MRVAVSRAEITVLILACIATAIFLYVIGGYEPWITTDTGSYLHPGWPPEAWARARNPLFGWALAFVSKRDFTIVPPLQTLLYLLATALLYCALRTYGLSVRAAAAVTASLLISNLLLIWHNAVLPELAAATFAILALAHIFWLAAGRNFAWHAILLGVTLGLSYMLRPTLLPAILLFPALFAVLARLRGVNAVLAQSLLLLLASLTPFVVVSTLRWQSVGDFNIVSFGGFQMSGIAGLMLTDEIADRLPPDLAPLGHKIVLLRTQAEARGDVLPTPLNSEGERSFISAAIGYYDIYARTYDNLLYGEILHLGRGQSWVAFNRQLLRLSLATIFAAPSRYLAWVVGGTARSVGRLVVTNAPMMLTIIAIAILYPVALWKRASGLVRPLPHQDIAVLVCLTTAYVVAAGALPVLVSFPARRYLDTTALFLPALGFYALFSLVSELWEERDQHVKTAKAAKKGLFKKEAQVASAGTELQRVVKL